METIPGTYVPKVDTGNPKVDTLVNLLVFPTIMEFEQIIINYESATILDDRLVRFTYSNWNEAYPVELYLNGGQRSISSDLFEVDYRMGKITLGFGLMPGDNLQATYCFNYFPLEVLQGFIQRAVIVANTAGNSATTSYTIENIPDDRLGVLADLVIAMCMEKLILEYDLWKGRLIFAVPAGKLYRGRGKIVSQLKAVGRNSERRAWMSLNNPAFRTAALPETPAAS